MTFRNPITSLRADQIEPGTLAPGVLLPASQVSAGTLDLAVVARSIADGAVTPQALADAAVTGPKIAAGAVTADAIGAGQVIAGKIAAGAVGAAEIAAGAIVAGKIDAGAITADKLSADAIDGKVITGATLRTAATGKRTQIPAVGSIDFYSGRPDESDPAGLYQVNIDANQTSQLVMGGARIGTAPRPLLGLITNVGGTTSEIVATATQTRVDGRLKIGSGPARGSTAILMRRTALQALTPGAWTPIAWNQIASQLTDDGSLNFNGTYLRIPAGWWSVNVLLTCSTAQNMFVRFQSWDGDLFAAGSGNVPMVVVGAAGTFFLGAETDCFAAAYVGAAANVQPHGYGTPAQITITPAR